HVPFLESLAQNIQCIHLIAFVHSAKMFNNLVLIAGKHGLTCMEDRIAAFADHFKAEELHSASPKIEAPFLVAEKNLSALPAVDAAMLSVF
ncbi:MAG TPA: hypothetical protein VGF82_27260, partial [Terracidiphilus sp.]